MLLSTWKSGSACFLQMFFYLKQHWHVAFNFTLTFSLGAVFQGKTFFLYEIKITLKWVCANALIPLRNVLRGCVALVKSLHKTTGFLYLGKMLAALQANQA